MEDKFSSNFHQEPSNTLDRLRIPFLRHGQEPLSNKEIIGQNPDPKVDSIGPKVSTGHPLHPKATLNLLNVVFDLHPAIVLPHHLFRALSHHVRGNTMIIIYALKQIPLPLPPSQYDYTESRFPPIHRM